MDYAQTGMKRMTAASEVLTSGLPCASEGGQPVYVFNLEPLDGT